MTMGTNDKKKTGFLIVLGLGALYGVYSNLSGPSNSSATSTAPSGRATAARGQADADSGTAASGASTPAASQPTPDVRRATPGGRARGEEFRPVLHSKRKEDQIDPIIVDPTLRTELLAKVQDVKLEGGQRNLFQFGPIQQLKGDEAIVKPRPQFGPFPVVETKVEPVKVVEAPPTPVTFKYYGLSTTRINGKKTAFFLDGEEIILATEGMVVKKRYKVVRIGPTSVMLEDVDSKKQQTVNYTEEQNASGG